MPIINGLQKKGRDADKYFFVALMMTLCKSMNALQMNWVAVVSCLLMAMLPVTSASHIDDKQCILSSFTDQCRVFVLLSPQLHLAWVLMPQMFAM